MIDQNVLSRSPIFEGMTEGDLEQLASISSELSFGEGDRLVGRGERAESFYVIHEGRFALTIVMTAAGHQVEVPIEEKSAGDALGWSSLVEPRTSIYSIYCTEQGSVISLPGPNLEALLAADSGLGYRFMTMLSQLVSSRARVLQELWIDEVEQSMSRVKYWMGQKISV